MTYYWHWSLSSPLPGEDRGEAVQNRMASWEGPLDWLLQSLPKSPLFPGVGGVTLLTRDGLILGPTYHGALWNGRTAPGHGLWALSYLTRKA